ncbi:TPA: QVPTGV class sortase B protein-sorting domain-containing protein [Streptococcus pyogenes]
MKKNKLLLATAILATTLGMASMSQNVKAEGGVSTGSILNVKKTFSSYNDIEVLMPNATFTFKIQADTVKNGEKDKKSGLDIKTGIMGEGLVDQIVTYTNDSKPVDKEKNVNFDFSKVEFPNVGIYRYKVSEEKGNVAGVRYDDKTWTVDVYVVSENGNFIPKYIISTTTENDKKPIVFDNEFTTTSLIVKKQVLGNSGDKTEGFDFTLLLKENSLFDKGKQVSLIKITSDQKEEKVKVTIGEKYDFKLKDGEQVKLDKLPIGINYQVNEKDANTNGYTTTAAILEGNGTSQPYTLDSLKETDLSIDTITVTNKRDTQVPTGVVGTLAPFAVLSIVAIGGVIYITKRKKA